MNKLKLILRIFMIYIRTNKTLIKSAFMFLKNIDNDSEQIVDELAEKMQADKDIVENKSRPQFIGTKYPVYCMTCGAELIDVWLDADGLEVVPVCKDSVIACKECSSDGKDTIHYCQIIPKESIVWM